MCRSNSSKLLNNRITCIIILSIDTPSADTLHLYHAHVPGEKTRYNFKIAWQKLTDLPTDATCVPNTYFIVCASVTERLLAFMEFLNNNPSSDYDVTGNY